MLPLTFLVTLPELPTDFTILLKPYSVRTQCHLTQRINHQTFPDQVLEIFYCYQNSNAPDVSVQSRNVLSIKIAAVRDVASGILTVKSAVTPPPPRQGLEGQGKAPVAPIIEHRRQYARSLLRGVTCPPRVACW